MKVIIISCLTILLWAMCTHAEYLFDHLQVNTDACTIVHSGTGNEDVVWRGEPIYGGLCSITVPLSEFSSKYKYCTLSGILSKSGSVMCEFGYADRQRSKVFFLGRIGNVCQFICIKAQ